MQPRPTIQYIEDVVIPNVRTVANLQFSQSLASSEKQSGINNTAI